MVKQTDASCVVFGPDGRNKKTLSALLNIGSVEPGMINGGD